MKIFVFSFAAALLLMGATIAALPGTRPVMSVHAERWIASRLPAPGPLSDSTASSFATTLATTTPPTRTVTAYLPVVGPIIQAVANETPAGALDGKNTVFTLAANLYPASLFVFTNGLLQTPSVDFVLSFPGGIPTLTFSVSPGSDAIVRAYYQRSL